MHLDVKKPIVNKLLYGPLGLIVSKGSGSCLNQISGFEPENDTKSIVSIIGPQNVGSIEPRFDPDM